MRLPTGEVYPGKVSLVRPLSKDHTLVRTPSEFPIRRGYPPQVRTQESCPWGSEPTDVMGSRPGPWGPWEGG